MHAVAFYLPQYHVIPENEAVYGPGFTEWNNVDNAVPLFPGHYQPHVPTKLLGHYNLLDPRAITLQHALAMEFGVDGFCYYYYNFGGKRLLEQPLDLICRLPLQNSFCLCWPHTHWYNNNDKENVERQIFLYQTYSLEAAKQLAEDVCKYFTHSRYIFIDDKPLFLIFAPERHPLMVPYAEILRETVRKHGFAGICLAGVEAFAAHDPVSLGLDIMVEFAPNWYREDTLSEKGEEPRRIDFKGTILRQLSKSVPAYTRLRCVFPSWDNTPRRGKRGLACVNNSPALYQYALQNIYEYTQTILPINLQYIFINAWNEWGEGCHLEPDMKYNLQWLEATKSVMRRK